MAGPSTTGSVATGLLALTFLLDTVHGGIYTLHPPSRPMIMSPLYQEHHTDDFEDLERCPSCLNSGGPDAVRARGIANTNGGVLDAYGGGEWPLLEAYEMGKVADNGNFLEPNRIAVRHGLCGDPKEGALNSTYPYSTPASSWFPVDSYYEGGEIHISVVVTEHLYGHLEFFICNPDDVDDELEQECFNQYPLTRVAGDSNNSPIDPAFSGRYYLDPPCLEDEEEDPFFLPVGAQDGYVVNMNYYVPEGLTCEHCVLQMVYYTGATCKYVGYDEFDPESWPSECAPDKSDWISVNRPLCGTEDAYPEEFHSCSDIQIRPSCSDGVQGIETNGVCCSTLCSQCGGRGCSDAGELCCTADIYETGVYCDGANGTGEAPCIIGSGPEFAKEGCYTDEPGDDRIMMNRLISEDMTAEVCQGHCQGSLFFGTQDGNECWCGESDESYDVHGKSDDCDTPCSGDDGEICGGRWAMTVYKNELVF